MRYLFILLFLFSNALFAYEINLKGALVSDSNCAYFSTTTGYFSLSFRDDEHFTVWGDKVFLMYGYSDNGFPWTRSQSFEMKNAGPYLWSVDFHNIVASRGNFYFSSLDFVVRVDHENGTSDYFKGSNSQLGYFSADLTQTVQCSMPEVLETIPFKAVLKS